MCSKQNSFLAFQICHSIQGNTRPASGDWEFRFPQSTRWWRFKKTERDHDPDGGIGTDERAYTSWAMKENMTNVLNSIITRWHVTFSWMLSEWKVKKRRFSCHYGASKRCMTHKWEPPTILLHSQIQQHIFKKGKRYTSRWKIVCPLVKKLEAPLFSSKWSNSSGSSIYSHKPRQEK